MHNLPSGDTPQICGSAYTSSTLIPSEMAANAIMNVGQLMTFTEAFDEADMSLKCSNPIQQVKARSRENLKDLYKQTETDMANPNARRIVQVFIADPNENVPLEKSVLFTGEQKLTDLTDTELFFEVPIADLLKLYNEKRKSLIDKEASKRAGKDVFLEPVRIRELKMVVVTIAQF